MKQSVLVNYLINIVQLNRRIFNEPKESNVVSGFSSPGAERLSIYLKSRFGGNPKINYNGYMRGYPLSLHDEGRAVDLFFKTGPFGDIVNITEEHLKFGQKIFDHILSIACDTGIQEIVFNNIKKAYILV
uniref:Uncharacterized protein n=1 Tax=Acrobeloides nanus TaxID=290746 RepID=A0A914EL92_9BILA